MKPPHKVEIISSENVFLVKVEKGGHFPENTIENFRINGSKTLLKYLRGLYKEEAE